VGEGSKVTDSKGVIWRVLHDDGNGHKLIMTEYVYGNGTRYLTSGSWIPLDSGTTLKAALLTFYQDTMGSEVKDVAVAYETPLLDVRSSYGSFVATENAAAGRSKAGTATANPTGSNVVFVLSVSEANEYFSDNTARTGYNVIATGSTLSWWLRSPGASAATSASYVYTNGIPYGNVTPADTTRGYRPALW
jgi:hypothetical protein